MGGFILSFLMVSFSPSSQSEDRRAAPTTLQEITRDAQERLRQWDEQDKAEEKLAGRDWFFEIVDLALSVAFFRGGHIGSLHAVGFSAPDGVTFQAQERRALSAPGPTAKNTQ